MLVLILLVHSWSDHASSWPLLIVLSHGRHSWTFSAGKRPWKSATGLGFLSQVFAAGATAKIREVWNHWITMKQHETTWIKMNEQFIQHLGKPTDQRWPLQLGGKKMLLWAFAAQEILMTWGRERMSSWKSWRNTRTSWRTALLEGAKYTVT